MQRIYLNVTGESGDARFVEELRARRRIGADRRQLIFDDDCDS